MSKLSNYYGSYCNWVIKNPSTISEIENAFTWATMVFCAKNESQVWPEFLYSTSNLMILHNDVAILKKPFSHGTVVKICLSVIEYCEVLLEVTALSKGRSKHLPMIFVIQVIKCLGRLYLIKSYNEFLISNPPFEPLNREEIDEIRVRHNPRRLRTYRQSAAHELKIGVINTDDSINKAPITVMKTLYRAEIIFTLKPLLHLVAMCRYGERSWIPWLLSLSLDVVSNMLHAEGMALFPTRRKIIIQRYIRLLLYFLRSPLYEHVFQTSAVAEIKKHLVTVPIFGTLIQLILSCILKYRHYYFYLWSH